MCMSVCVYLKIVIEHTEQYFLKRSCTLKKITAVLTFFHFLSTVIPQIEEFHKNALPIFLDGYKSILLRLSIKQDGK